MNKDCIQSRDITAPPLRSRTKGSAEAQSRNRVILPFPRKECSFFVENEKITGHHAGKPLSLPTFFRGVLLTSAAPQEAPGIFFLYTHKGIGNPVSSWRPQPQAFVQGALPAPSRGGNKNSDHPSYDDGLYY